MKYTEVIVRTLAENQSFCMDDEEDRKKLAKKLDEAIHSDAFNRIMEAATEYGTSQNDSEMQAAYFDLERVVRRELGEEKP